jgi:ribose transport system permease protein
MTAGRLLSRATREWQAYVAPVSLVALFAVFSLVLRDDGFLTSTNLLNILAQTAPISVMAVGVVFTLSAGEIDLSFAAVVGLAALVCAVVLRDTGSVALGAAAGIGVGVTVGAVNGLLVTWARLPSFIVTLAVAGVVAGLSRSITELRSVPVVSGTFIAVFGGSTVLGVSTVIVWAVAVAAVGHHILRMRRAGAHVLAVGDSRDAAGAAGIRVDRVRVGVLVASAGTAALAGLLYTGRLQGARYNLGEMELMTVIAAVVVGGTRLFGGRGSILGAVQGALLMGLLSNGLILAGLTVSQQMIARGVLILAAVALTLREPRR